MPRQEEGENQSQETGSQDSSLGSIVPMPSPLSQFLPLRNSPEPSSDAPSPPPAQDLSFLDDMPTQQEAGSKVGDPLAPVRYISPERKIEGEDVVENPGGIEGEEKEEDAEVQIIYDDGCKNRRKVPEGMMAPRRSLHSIQEDAAMVEGQLNNITGENSTPQSLLKKREDVRVKLETLLENVEAYGTRTGGSRKVDPIWDLGQRIQKMLRANEQATNKLKILLEDQARQGDHHQHQEPRLEEPDQATPHNDNNEDEDIIQTTPQPKKVERRKMDTLNRLRRHNKMVERQQHFKKNMEDAGGNEASHMRGHEEMVSRQLQFEKNMEHAGVNEASQNQATATEEQSSNMAVEERPNSQTERPACT